MFTLPPVLNSSYVGIHGNSTFINFEFSFYTLPMLFLLVPILYIPITIIIILRILVKLYYAFRDRNNNVYLLSAISISQCMVSWLEKLTYFQAYLPTRRPIYALQHSFMERNSNDLNFVMGFSQTNNSSRTSNFLREHKFDSI